MRRLIALAVLATVPVREAAAELRITITRPDCERLVQHVPTPDTAYQPGRDAYGRPVVPADLAGPGVAPPLGVVIDVTSLLQGRLAGSSVSGRRRPAPAEAPPYVAEAYVGRITVAPDGRAWFNGQPLYDPEQDALAALCRSRLR